MPVLEELTESKAIALLSEDDNSGDKLFFDVFKTERFFRSNTSIISSYVYDIQRILKPINFIKILEKNPSFKILQSVIYWILYDNVSINKDKSVNRNSMERIISNVFKFCKNNNIEILEKIVIYLE